MQIVRKRAYARAGLVGNPSDGFGGKTISIIVRNFQAEVVLYEWDTVEIVLAKEDRVRFRSVQDLARDVTLRGYYGGIRLVKATIKRFVDYCQGRGLALHDRSFSIRYQTSIPRQVGLAGSSAIVVATLRALMEYYGVEIPQEAQPSFVLSVELEELGIAAGLQDRVVQVYEGMVYMDFDKAHEREIDGFRCYLYEPLDPALLPPIFIAYSDHLSEPADVFQVDMWGRFARGEQVVLTAMQRFAHLAEEAREALHARDGARLGRLMDENFETRRGIYALPDWQVQMVAAARACGATAKLAGSGGAIIGTYTDDATFERLAASLRQLGCRTVRPIVA